MCIGVLRIKSTYVKPVLEYEAEVKPVHFKKVLKIVHKVIAYRCTQVW